MNKLREELLSGLRETINVRPAALRRSLREDYLYATDLSAVATEEAFLCFCRRMKRRGWRMETEGEWLLLDREVKEPPENGFFGPFGPEAACCASLLERHQDASGVSAAREIRMLIKAGEQGADTYEQVCRRLHMEWADALRNRQELPSVHQSFFTEER